MNSRSHQITLQPAVLRWARERVEYQIADLAHKIGVGLEKVEKWEQTGHISIAQIDKLARKTYTPLGALYLPEPPEYLNRLTVADFRTRSGRTPERLSPDLIDTVHTMQRRQAWMREELLRDGVDSIPFIGSFEHKSQRNEIASAMKKELGLGGDWAAGMSTWEHALRYLRTCIEDAGILIVVNGVVGNNTYRKLNPKEFQGFALVDEYAPLIFVNGADFKSAQMFTIAHELAHIFTGAAGVSRFRRLRQEENATEKFCDHVAAEFLVPSADIRAFLNNNPSAKENYKQIARYFKVSTIVAARRMLDVELIGLNTFFEFYERWKKEEWTKQKNKKPGGDYWNNQNVRIGRPFGAAIARAVCEGRLPYREAHSMTGIVTGKSFDKFIRKFSE